MPVKRKRSYSRRRRVSRKRAKIRREFKKIIPFNRVGEEVFYTDQILWGTDPSTLLGAPYYNATYYGTPPGLNFTVGTPTGLGDGKRLQFVRWIGCQVTIDQNANTTNVYPHKVGLMFLSCLNSYSLTTPKPQNAFNMVSVDSGIELAGRLGPNKGDALTSGIRGAINREAVKVVWKKTWIAPGTARAPGGNIYSYRKLIKFHPPVLVQYTTAALANTIADVDQHIQPILWTATGSSAPSLFIKLRWYYNTFKNPEEQIRGLEANVAKDAEAGLTRSTESLATAAAVLGFMAAG